MEFKVKIMLHYFREVKWHRRPNFAFGSLDCSNCLWVDGGGLRQKVLFRGG